MRRRAAGVAALLALALAAVLGAWFATGWPEVRARQRATRQAPTLAATRRAAELAHELRGQLAELVRREAERPYFHYQNLFHDPRSAAAGPTVAPSPLAGPSLDPLVLGYFQIDDAGRVTTPTINDDEPGLSEPTRLAANQAFRDEVARTVVAALPRPSPLVASAAPAKVASRPRPSTIQAPSRVQAQALGNEPAAQVVEISPDVYAQNNMPTQVYQQIRDNNAAPPAPPRPAPPHPAPPHPAVAAPGAPITITVSAPAWTTVEFAGAPALVAVRRVETPDHALTQGFVVDRATLTSWLAAHAGDTVATLRSAADAADAPGDDAAELVAGWHLAVDANPRQLARAERDADQLATGFALRFGGVGVIVALIAALVILVVARAERLARERSQFAAAAAHELRTPLAGLQLYGDMLAEGLGDPARATDYARRMSEEAARLGRVVSNVLGFSQLERGNLSVAPAIAPIAPTVAELLRRAGPTLERAGATITVDVDAELQARFDPDALTRIVGNLVDNAEKYGRGRPARTIAISARAVDDAVELAIADDGPGVPAAARARLFAPFTRGVDGDGPPGLGLGLALSRSLARAMGGDLAHRPSAAGATFVVTLRGA